MRINHQLVNVSRSKIHGRRGLPTDLTVAQHVHHVAEPALRLARHLGRASRRKALGTRGSTAGRIVEAEEIRVHDLPYNEDVGGDCGICSASSWACQQLQQLGLQTRSGTIGLLYMDQHNYTCTIIASNYWHMNMNCFAMLVSPKKITSQSAIIKEPRANVF